MTSRPARAAVSLSLLPGEADGTWAYNAAPFCQDNLTSDNGTQYAAWWGPDAHPYIASRPLPSGAWTRPVDLQPWLGTVPADGHNVLAVAVDGNGHVHVSGNMHAKPLLYARTTTPRDITSWQPASMTGIAEAAVTYPAFVRQPDGGLLFFYRDGVSGEGDIRANRYDPATGLWTGLGVILDGRASGESPYPNRYAIDSCGDVHVFWCWRGTGNANTNADLSYLRLHPTSGTVTASRSDGTAQNLPATHADCEIVLPTAATGSGMVNSHGADVDTDGHPHTATWLYDQSGATQIMHVWHDGTTWQVEQVSDLTVRIDLDVPIISPSLSRVAVACDHLGATTLIYRANHDARSGTVRGIDVTTPGQPLDFRLADLDLYEWEPCIDSRANRERGELSMLLTPCTATGVTPARPVENWGRQWAGVLTVTQLGLLRAGAARLPGLRMVGAEDGPASGGIQVTTTALADLPIGQVMVPDRPGRVWLVRLQARLDTSAAGTTITVRCKEHRQVPDQAVGYGALLSSTALASSPDVIETPWVPLRLFGNGPGQAGWVHFAGMKAGAGTGRVTLAALHLAHLDY